MAINQNLLNAIDTQIKKISNAPVPREEIYKSTKKLISFFELLITIDKKNKTCDKKSL